MAISLSERVAPPEAPETSDPAPLDPGWPIAVAALLDEQAGQITQALLRRSAPPGSNLLPWRPALAALPTIVADALGALATAGPAAPRPSESRELAAFAREEAERQRTRSPELADALARLKHYREPFMAALCLVELEPTAVHEATHFMLEVFDRIELEVCESWPSAMAGLPGRMQPANLGELARGAAQLLEARFGSSARLHFELDPELPEVWCDVAALRQAVYEVVHNAGLAIEETLGAEPDARGTIVVRALAQAGRVIIEVEDDGPGIAAAFLRWIFEPGFSTRAGARGEGLTYVREVVAQQHNGTIEVVRRADGGTRVQLELPAAAPAPA